MKNQENNKSDDKNINKIKKNKKIKYKTTTQELHKPRLILDAVLFFIILLAVSIPMVMISAEPKEKNQYYINYEDSDEYIDDSMQMILDSTVPNVTYQDLNGIRTEVNNLNIADLILIDLIIRSGDPGEVNFTSLENEFEAKLFTILDSVFGGNRDFMLIVGPSNLVTNGAEQNYSEYILITNINPSPQLQDLNQFDFTYEKRLTKLDNVKNKLNNGEIIVKLYLE